MHPRADEWVLSGGPNFAGECLALRGDRGHVDVRLREAVVVAAVTVEHVGADVAYDLSSAPKSFAVFGWNRTREPPEPARSHDFGGALRYELGASSRGAAQTFAFDETRARCKIETRDTRATTTPRWVCFPICSVAGAAMLSSRSKSST